MGREILTSTQALGAALVLAATLIFSGLNPTSAEAYCCWNPAICKAVCGSACCGNNLTTKPKNEASFSRIPVADLKAEAKRAKGGDAFSRGLDMQIKARSTSKKMKTR